MQTQPIRYQPDPRCEYWTLDPQWGGCATITQPDGATEYRLCDAHARIAADCHAEAVLRGDAARTARWG